MCIRDSLGWNGGGVTVRSPLELTSGLLDYVAGFDLVHSSVYSRSEPQLPRLAGGPALVSFDLSSEDEFRTPAYLDRICPSADLVLLSCSHLGAEPTRALLAEAIGRGASVALATRGTDGAIVTDGTVTVEADAHLVEDPSARCASASTVTVPSVTMAPSVPRVARATDAPRPIASARSARVCPAPRCEHDSSTRSAEGQTRSR